MVRTLPHLLMSTGALPRQAQTISNASTPVPVWLATRITHKASAQKATVALCAQTAWAGIREMELSSA